MENSMHNSRLCVMCRDASGGSTTNRRHNTPPPNANARENPGKASRKVGGDYSAGAATVFAAVTASDLASPYRIPATTT